MGSWRVAPGNEVYDRDLSTIARVTLLNFGEMAWMLK